MTTFLIITGVVYFLLILWIFIISLSIKFDEDHNAQKSSWHYKLFMLLMSYDKDTTPPKTVCSYFWLYSLHILLFPFLIPTFIVGLFNIPFNDEKNGDLYRMNLAIYIVLFISLLIGNKILDGKMDFLYVVYSTLTGLGFLTTGLGITIGVIYLIQEFKEYLQNRPGKVKKEKKKSLLITRIKSWKEKRCPIINWE